MSDESQTPNSPSNGQEPTAAKQNPEPTPDANARDAETQPQPGAAAKVDELPEWAQKEIREARAEAAKYRNERKKAEEEAAQREEQRMAEQQQWKELAEKRQARVVELEPKVAEVERLQELVTRQLEAEINAWPDSVKSIIPTGEEMSALQMLEWAERLRPLAKEMMQERTPTPGNSKGPKPAGPSGSGEAEKAAKTEQGRVLHRNF